MTGNAEAIPGWVLWAVCPERTRLALNGRIRKEASRLPFVVVFLIAAALVSQALQNSFLLWIGIANAIGATLRMAELLMARRRLDHARAWEALAAIRQTAPERFRECTTVPKWLAVMVVAASTVAFVLLLVRFAAP